MLPKPAFDLGSLLARPEFLRGAATILGFVILVSVLVIWSREQVKVGVGQIMTDTRVKRIDYPVEDVAATKARRDEARRAAARLYRLNESYLGRLEASLRGLPTALAGKTSLEEISHEIQEEYLLTPDGLASLQIYANVGTPATLWQGWVSKLVHEQLPRHPLIDSREYQVFSTTANKALIGVEGRIEPIRGSAIELLEEPGVDLSPRFQELVAAAGFPAATAPFLWAKLAFDRQSTIHFDESATAEHAERAATLVKPEVVVHKTGAVIYSRGDRLSAQQFEDLMLEGDWFLRRAGLATIWLPRAGVVGLIAILGALITGYGALFYRRMTRNALRLAAICALMCGMLAVTIMLTVQAPRLIWVAAVAPTLLAVIVLLLSYDQRLALFLGFIQCTLVTLALEQSVAWLLLLVGGCGTAIVQLAEVRHRHTLIRASMVTAIVLGIGTILLGVLEVPAVAGAWEQVLRDAFGSTTAAFGVGFLMLGILPSIERAFDITTGMTLAELRDPKQPLLRQLQVKAPGTYNHSLQVANIAEAAAEAIGVNGLLVYVGAMYHDIGKMNKPEYFVENQVGRHNKHDKLSPSMSLLVIVGHVKDGIELAREYNLPRSIIHFIESHHGTTLVEYFYRAARSLAEDEDREPVAEIEFRYPGPKPQTKEAAILMLSDAVQSATRAMAEPTPGRIENLVWDLARKRLMDGQFDACELNFRELNTICESIIKSVCATYHSRIAYPPERGEDEPVEDEAEMVARSASA